ncbi:DUF397 domain-containing protein [Nocardia brasiliensis]|uniref:DUF397 domain-containing protein n=1 Tax=Nocardia brasiliensis TaxID=37326 RepID=UPI002454D928|nr:DUF397 domain-containing protein [Nocardia brasiliensis]
MTGRRPTEGYVKSPFSDQGGQCVLIRRVEGDLSVFIRDSKYQRNPHNRPEDEPIIEMPSTAWTAFEDAVLKRRNVVPAAGQPGIEELGTEGVALHGTDGATLIFTPGEWAAFQAGLVAREFEPRHPGGPPGGGARGGPPTPPPQKK